MQSVFDELQLGWFLCFNHILFVAFNFNVWSLHFDNVIFIAQYFCWNASWLVLVWQPWLCWHPINVQILLTKPFICSCNILKVCEIYEYGKIWKWQSMYVNVSLPQNWWFWQLCKMRKGSEFFPKIIIPTFQGIKWLKVRKYHTLTYPFKNGWELCTCGCKILFISSLLGCENSGWGWKSESLLLVLLLLNLLLDLLLNVWNLLLRSPLLNATENV